MPRKSRLFVIGNGFDLAHGLKTGYSDFKKFLEELDPEYSEQYSSQIYASPFYGTPAHTVVCLLSKVLGNQWQDVEAACGELILDDCFKLWNAQTMPNDVERGQLLSRDISYDILKRLRTIGDYLSKWISTIDTSSCCAISDFEKLIHPTKDQFMTFNYTDTLESVYSVRQARHLHGRQGGPLLFGHGNNKRDQYDYLSYIANGCQSGLSALHKYLRKDVATVIEQNLVWFESLADTDEVFSYGFSYAEVDLKYIEKICHVLDKAKRVVWYLNDFNKPNELLEYRQRILSCGFKGAFDTFHA